MVEIESWFFQLLILTIHCYYIKYNTLGIAPNFNPIFHYPKFGLSAINLAIPIILRNA